MSISKEIRKYRRELDLTQKDLCDSVNSMDNDVLLSQREVSMLEGDKGNPSLNKIEAIAKALKKKWKLI